MADPVLKEDEMFEPMEEYLEENGYNITEINDGYSSGADIIANKHGKKLVIEMKGHTQALTTDIRTCIGQICGQMEEGSAEYAVALSESYKNYIDEYAFALEKLGVQILLVSEKEVKTWDQEH